MPIKQIRPQQDGVKSRCPAHMVDFCHAVEPILLLAVEMLRYVNSHAHLCLWLRSRRLVRMWFNSHSSGGLFTESSTKLGSDGDFFFFFYFSHSKRLSKSLPKTWHISPYVRFVLMGDPSQVEVSSYANTSRWLPPLRTSKSNKWWPIRSHCKFCPVSLMDGWF